MTRAGQAFQNSSRESDMTAKTAVKERPIIFTGEMVRAILEGRKNQTRRAVKPKRGWHIEFVGGVGMENDPTCWGFESDDCERWALQGDDECRQIPCPYGRPGDQLWVREAFSGPYCMEKQEGIPSLPPKDWPECSDLWYWSDGSPDHGDWTRPKPSIHMPRWASRILLEVVSVRVERLNDISASDAMAEGIERPQGGTYRDYGVLPESNEGYDYCTSPTASFKTLWKSINGAGSWDENPFVWVVTFKRIPQ